MQPYKNISAFICGLIFSLGLIFAGMINPKKVLDFLDVTGDWDPSLLLVMAAALITLGLLQYFIFQRPAPVLEEKFSLPTATQIDKRLLAGAAIFGIGWGLAGFCPGPALVGLGFGSVKNLIFVLGLLGGMGIFKLLHGRK